MRNKIVKKINSVISKYVNREGGFIEAKFRLYADPRSVKTVF